MLVGQQIGPFAIEKELGAGAMGAVYRGLYTKTGQRVAIKVMLPGMAENEQASKRFEREAAILKQFNHPNIVRLFGVGKHQGMRYYAMEYIVGESLDRTLSRRGRLTWEEVVTLGQQLCAALQHAHQQGVVHRDLKPSNLMLLPDGTLKLTDFGIAKDLDGTQLTSANCTVGTASYMSPEQCRGERVLTHKSDLYSLGIVFYELLTGTKPFVCENVMDMFLAHVQGTFERPSRLVHDIPKWLDTLVCQLLEKTADNRPFDADAVSNALARVLEKVEAKQSAGAEAARGRVVDRKAGETRPDDNDREAAQSLLVSGKKKRKKKIAKEPFYRHLWFQGVGLAGLLLALAGVLYLLLKPPSADTLYRRIDKLMASKDPASHKAAFNGPIREYLKRYGTLSDDKTKQVQAWDKQIGVRRAEEDLEATKERAKKIDLEKMDDLSALEREAVKASRAEDKGNLTEAERLWNDIARGDQEKRNDRYLAEVARSRAAQFQAARAHLLTLDDSLQKIVEFSREPKVEDPIERKALRALRFERFGDPFEAKRRWETLRDELHGKPTQRSWFLLAAERQHLIRLPRGEAEKPFRLSLIEKKLAEAEKQRTAMNYKKAEILCLHIRALYTDAPEKEVADLARKAAKLFDDIQKERVGKP